MLDADARVRRSGARAAPTPPRRAARGCATSSTSASAAATSGRRWRSRALAGFAHPGLAFHFVANVDGADLAAALAGVAPAETLFVVASKTFTTQETMANAETAKRLVRRPAAARGSTSTSSPRRRNVEAAARFGITRTFGFWDWVGGRYSLWSAIGLPIAIAIGADRFRELLAGARAMDEHFAQARRSSATCRCCSASSTSGTATSTASRAAASRRTREALQRLPAYLQQLEMESNGKRVDRAGEPLPFATSPVVWGEPGTNAQHAYFQMLHQGSDVVPVEFILVARADRDRRRSRPRRRSRASTACCSPTAWRRARR